VFEDERNVHHRDEPIFRAELSCLSSSVVRIELGREGREGRGGGIMAACTPSN
jgi:hypothetical protein